VRSLGNLQEPTSAVARDLLAERAARYAEVTEVERKVFATAVTFRRGEGKYALALVALREVRPLPYWCRMPGARAAVPGLVHYRGELLSLHDLSAFLSTESSREQATWLLVTEHEGIRIGLMADDVMDVVDVEADKLMPVPITLGEAGECFVGLAEGRFLLIDPARLFAARAIASAF
jgi:chemotaxis signal transduction protein